MRHQWERGESVQWSELGLDGSAAATPFHCIVCGTRFTHFYHNEPNIYRAMAAVGIDNEKCPGPEASNV